MPFYFVRLYALLLHIFSSHEFVFNHQLSVDLFLLHLLFSKFSPPQSCKENPPCFFFQFSPARLLNIGRLPFPSEFCVFVRNLVHRLLLPLFATRLISPFFFVDLYLCSRIVTIPSPFFDQSGQPVMDAPFHSFLFCVIFRAVFLLCDGFLFNFSVPVFGPRLFTWSPPSYGLHRPAVHATFESIRAGPSPCFSMCSFSL